MPQYAFGVTYCGTNFHGWQRQTQLPTVQGELERAISHVANVQTQISAAGRTDAGVHATGQVAAFHSDADRTLQNWQRGLNALTPDDILVDWVLNVDDHFHPRFSATARRYTYLFHDVGHPHPLLSGRVWSCQKLDADRMHRHAQTLLGEHDFSSFRGAGCQSMTPFRRINRCEVIRRGDFVVLEIEANAFLLHMVRNIASVLHTIGRRISVDLVKLLSFRDRTKSGPTAPPEGLYLVGVSYPDFDLPQPLEPAILGF